MHEYEFRLVVESDSPFLPLLQTLGVVKIERVLYAKPHFRYRCGKWETKRILSAEAVYHDHHWFKWVHSLETPFGKWSSATNSNFLHVVGNFQDPFRVELRHRVNFNKKTCMYSFKVSENRHRLIFEWEYGHTMPSNTEALLKSLSAYRNIYKKLQNYAAPAGYALDETMTRKPVRSEEIETNESDYLYAWKWDGIFGLVFSYPNRLKEKWEDCGQTIRPHETLGDGLVFAAEKMDHVVVLLDVYQVRGCPTASWSRRAILTQFLPQIKRLPEGYRVQVYGSTKPSKPEGFEFDGWIAHDVSKDVIYKFKFRHSIDVVYFSGYFWLSDGRKMKSEESLEDGSVYEVSLEGRVLRKRTDRFKGNTAEQLKNELGFGWRGPAIVEDDEVGKKKRKKMKK